MTLFGMGVLELAILAGVIVIVIVVIVSRRMKINKAIIVNRQEMAANQQQAAVLQQPTPGGQQQTVASLPTKQINKVAYILFCVLLGSIGVHRFVRGQIGLGILYIITLGGLGIATLADFVIALLKLSHYPNAENFEFTTSPNGYWTK